ncbi:MAG TPA: hypothetical protein VMT29_05265, partial [Steroidobacteraceae bacterium]|nr:hypothetical protein [Steroidobacteraceae bacterium]
MALTALASILSGLLSPAGMADEQIGHEVLHSLPDADLIAEDVAFESRDGSYIVTSVRQRKVLRIAADGTVTDLLTASQVPMWGAFAVALDPSRNTLWVTTSA